MNWGMLLVVLIGTAAPIAWAGDARDETPRGKAEKFLERLGKGEITGAYDEIFVGAPVVTDKPQGLDVVKRQTEAALPLYGKALGFELQNERVFGESLVRLTYIQRLEKHPLIWRFWFYRPVDKWYLDSVIFNDQYSFLPAD
jgi:hypothetical protein